MEGRGILSILALIAGLAAGCSTTVKDVADEDDPDFTVSPLDTEALAERREREASDLAEAKRIAAEAGSEPNAVVALFDVEARLVDGIGRELNRIYSKVLRESGSAFPYGDRNLDLFKEEIAKSQVPVVGYYRENERAFRVDRRSQGGFLVTQSLWRLREIAGTPAGLARLFEERRKELRIELQSVCFPALDGICGDRPSAAECVKRVERFLVEFPEPDFREERRAVLKEHAQWLRVRRDQGWNPARADRAAAAAAIDPYVEKIEALAGR